MKKKKKKGETTIYFFIFNLLFYLYMYWASALFLSLLLSMSRIYKAIFNPMLKFHFYCFAVCLQFHICFIRYWFLFFYIAKMYVLLILLELDMGGRTGFLFASIEATSKTHFPLIHTMLTDFNSNMCVKVTSFFLLRNAIFLLFFVKY